MSISATTAGLIERIKARFATLAAGDRSAITAKDITQYNLTVDGAVVKTLVMNLKDFTLTEVADSNADIEITIAEQDVLDMWQNKTTLTALNAAGKITFKGNVELLAVLDERSQRHAAAAAAEAAAAAAAQ